MGLVVERPEASYELSNIKKGYLFYGKHKTWEEGKSGIVTSITEKELVVQYDPGIANITNHFFIPIAEVCAGEWEIRWSADLSDVFEYGFFTVPEAEEDDNELGKPDLQTVPRVSEAL